MGCGTVQTVFKKSPSAGIKLTLSPAVLDPIIILLDPGIFSLTGIPVSRKAVVKAVVVLTSRLPESIDSGHKKDRLSEFRSTDE